MREGLGYLIFAMPVSPRRLFLQKAFALPLAPLLAGTPQFASARTAESTAKREVTGNAQRLEWLNRIGWGATTSGLREIERTGLQRWLKDQLHPHPAPLPATAQAQIDAMAITRTPAAELAIALEAQRRALNDLADDAAKMVARKAYQQELTRLAREAQQRFLLRALYSPNALHEQMTWFWMNHFNVNARKANIRALVGDYEESAIRPHAVGRFRDLLVATARHPAMLRYLDNANNAAGKINENYARELMELHTLGAGGGYSQTDVQELARVFTGVGINLRDTADRPRVRPALAAQYRRDGLFEFNPNRHDYGDKVFLGQPIRASGESEIDEALDRLARAPATALFVSGKLAAYFLADAPAPALIGRLAATFERSDGAIATVLQTLFESDEFSASLGRKFRDPVHYVVAAVRLAPEDRFVTDPAPLLGWLQRTGEPLYGHETPDGYPLNREAWASAGQMATRFDIARAIGSRSAVLFGNAESPSSGQAPPPTLAKSAVVQAMLPTLGRATRTALEKADSVADWNTFFLASPEFMNG